ncbi:MAG: hypothetical protein J5632_06040 [Bacteroidales bacterium]|nr:hypothetical protein [Bacteroidales bacterium]
MKRAIIIPLLICFGIAAAAQDDYTPFDRGIDKSTAVFIPKGTSGAGFSFGFQNYKVGQTGEDDAGFSVPTEIVKGLSGAVNTFKLAPSYEYFLWDNTSLGARLTYSHSLLDLGNATLSMGDDLKFDAGDYRYTANSVSAFATLRNFMPISDSKRFAMILEARIGGSYGRSKSSKIEQGLKHGSYNDIWQGSFKFVPGLCVFVMNNVSVSAQMAIFGITYRYIDQTNDKVGRSGLSGANSSLGIDFLSVEIGTNFYILDRKHRPRK